MLGDDSAHHHRHGTGRAGNLGRGAAEYGGEEADRDRAV